MDNRPKVRRFLPETLRDTLFVRAFAWWKIPLIAFVRPRVVHVDEKKVEILIPLRRRTKNHLGSMYFGSLMIGADLAGAYYAAKLIFESGQKIDFVFKSASGRFLKRPMADVLFTCNDGEILRRLVERASETSERVDSEIQVIATVPSLGPEIVAEMTLVLSLKKRRDAKREISASGPTLNV